MSMTVTFILVLITIIVTLAGIVFVYHKSNKSLKAEKKQLLNKNEQLNKNIAYLVKHANELSQIQKEKEKTFQRIEETRTDEEIAEIVSVIVNSNNQRMQNVSEK